MIENDHRALFLLRKGGVHIVVSVLSGMVSGIHGEMIHVEIDVSNGLPMFNMIGYLSSEVKEAKERVRTAIKNSGYRLPSKRISINLSPADLRKSGTYFDLAIAVGILVAMEEISNDHFDDMLLLGELSLTGDLNAISGVLPIIMCAKESGLKRCIVPIENLQEAKMIEGIDIIGVHCLNDVISLINDGEIPAISYIPSDFDRISKRDCPDISSVKGQKLAKRALEIAAAGYHNLFLDGPPGAGKSMLAACIPGIMPDMNMDETLETSMIYSVKGLLGKENILLGERPYRTPSKNISITGMYGGGAHPMPGEASLAHHGVLFLDEFPEYNREIIDMLRVPLEEHKIIIVKNGYSCEYPSDFMLVTAANPCPCGYYPDRARCSCTETQIKRYKNRISGPILDRIDLFVRCEKIDYHTLTAETKQEKSETMKNRIQKAWEIQKSRFINEKCDHNGRMNTAQVKEYCILDDKCKRLMEKAYESFSLTGRSYYKVIKCARTIADLEGEQCISVRHLQEALIFRNTGQ